MPYQPMTSFSFATSMQKALSELKAVTGADFPSQQLAVLMDIAANPDTPIGEIGKRLDMTTSSASRAVAALANWSWTKKTGYGLVEKVEDKFESRRKLVRLTQDGRKLVDLMQQKFEKERHYGR